jgi:glycosyltransferase involved in cell wall biosynthesis
VSVPLLFLSDAVSSSSGLGRITRDLATRVHQHMPDVFRVGTVGYGGAGSRDIPFPCYHLHSIDNWLVPELPAIWDDFAGEEEGILMCIWDASRLTWLGIPQICPIPQLRRWVEEGSKPRSSGLVVAPPKIRKWLYGAIDAEGPNGKLSHRIAETYQGFDRVLDYSAFSSRITGHPDHLPHGVDSSVFYPRDHTASREALIKSGFQDLTHDSLLIGIVATNQARKNWSLGIRVCKILLDRGYDVRIWAHTDMIERYWSLNNLTADHGLVGRIAVTLSRFTDERMAQMYAACNVTLCIGPEGFGFPAAESLACGVPCIAGSYGAQAEFIPPHMLVKPIAFYEEGPYESRRPVYEAEKWADRVESVRRNAKIPECIDWNGSTLWPAWEKWFRGGI